MSGDVDKLRTVLPGDRPSASQWNLILDLLKREVTGPNVFADSTGWHIRPSVESIERIIHLFSYEAEVVELFTPTGASWTDYDTDGWIAFISVYHIDPVTGESLKNAEGNPIIKFLVATGAIGKAPIGYGGLAPGDRIRAVPWIPVGEGGQVPGFEPAVFSGSIFPFGSEKDAALIDFFFEAGEGLKWAEGENPEIYDRVLHLDLFLNGGLEISPTEEQLRVLPNVDKGIKVTADGVEVKLKPDGGILVDADGLYTVAAAITGGPGIDITDAKISVDLAAENPGLDFTTGDDGGQLRVKPNPEKGIEVGAAGVGVKLAAETPCLYFLAGGLAVRINPQGGLNATDLGLLILVDGERGIDIDVANNALYVILDPEGGIDVDAAGLKIRITAEQPAGIGFNAIDNGLQVIPGTTQGIHIVPDVGVAVRLHDDGHLEFDAVGPGPGAIKHKQPGVEVKRFYGWVAVDAFGHVVDGGEEAS